MPVQISVSQTVLAAKRHVFDTAASIDARRLIRKHGPLPAIVEVDGHDAPWSAIGQRRRHTLSDNSSVNEELVAFTGGETFAYRITNFTGPFAPLVREARGEWHFTTTGADCCRIDWTYFFTPNGPITEPALWFIVKLFWPGYLKSALSRVKEIAESQPL
jgi:Polyketide cyclase / dehydrase and lipid transport